MNCRFASLWAATAILLWGCTVPLDPESESRARTLPPATDNPKETVTAEVPPLRVRKVNPPEPAPKPAAPTAATESAPVPPPPAPATPPVSASVSEPKPVPPPPPVIPPPPVPMPPGGPRPPTARANNYRLMWQAFARLSQEEKQKLMEIQRRDPEKFRSVMLEKANELHARRQARRQELDGIAKKYRESSDPAEKERLKTELRDKLRADFNQRLQDTRRDLESNRKRLERMEVELRRREKNQDAIVEAVLSDKLAGREPPHRRK